MKKVNAHEATWQIVASNTLERIEQIRDALEREEGEIKTASLRGELRAFRSVLKWPELGQTDEPTEGIEFT